MKVPICGGPAERLEPRSAMSRNQRLKILVLAALGCIHIAITLLTIVPGYLSIDEALYHWMAKSFHDSGGLSLWNGYEEYPSIELVHPFIHLHNGRLFPPHPYLFPVIAWPFYHVAGFFGLFIVNALSFLGVVGLCFLTAKKLLSDLDLALDSCLVLIAATFAWEYSQAAWPHCLAMLGVSGAFYAMVCGYCATTNTRERLCAFVSGLVAGFAMAVRLDTILVMPTLVLPFLFARPWRPWDAAMVAVGALPGAAVLAVTNLKKFGVFSPLSYGQDGAVLYNRPVAPSLDLILIALFLIGLAWILTRPGTAQVLNKRWKTALFLSAAGGLLLVCLLPQAMPHLEKTIAYGVVSLVDIRSLDAEIVFPPMTRSAGGGVVYIGAHKKALLQSLPYLTLLVIPIISLWRRKSDFRAVATLLLAPISMMGYFSYAFLEGEGGGGLCVNQRYLLYCLPFLSILTAYSLRELRSLTGGAPRIYSAGLVCAGTAVVYYVLTVGLKPDLDALEFPLLVFPLLLAGLLLAFVTGSFVFGFEKSRVLKGPVWTLVLMAMTWSGLEAFCYDYPAHRYGRAADHDFGRSVSKVVSRDCLFVAGHGFFTASVALIENGRVRVAYPARDRFVDLPRLLDFHIRNNRNVYGVFRNEMWEELQAGPLKKYSIAPVLSASTYFVGQILPASGTSEQTR